MRETSLWIRRQPFALILFVFITDLIHMLSLPPAYVAPHKRKREHLPSTRLCTSLEDVGMSIKTTARIVGSLCAIGIVVGLFFLGPTPGLQSLPWYWVIGIGAMSALLAFIITPYISIVPYRWIRDLIRHAAASDLIAAAIGLIIGLIISALLAIPLANLPGNLGHLLPFIGTVLFSFLGVLIAVLQKDEIAHLFQTAFSSMRRPRERERDHGSEREEREKSPSEETSKKQTSSEESQLATKILLDTSAIIDGRIADISQTGFVFGTLVVPRFVLNELQHIADSSDTMRRTRGRRGLDMLNRLQKDAPVPVEIADIDIEGVAEVDGKLVKLARTWHCAIITNDFNLNRVAELQGVKVLNINELANAVKPVLLPGEDLPIKIMQDGKELGQGVGYLDDGTMIVVEGGRHYMNTTIEVTVTRVLQTVAGRMIFAHPKQGGNTVSPPSQSSSKQKQF